MQQTCRTQYLVTTTFAINIIIIQIQIYVILNSKEVSVIIKVNFRYDGDDMILDFTAKKIAATIDSFNNPNKALFIYGHTGKGKTYSP